MRSSFLAVTLPVAIATAACSAPPSESSDLAARSFAIQGGSNTTDHPYAVGLRIGFEGICSGALIAPNLVLTARHCVTNSPETINCATSRFGALTAGETGIYATTNPSIMAAGRSATPSTKIFTPTDTRVCGNDIALVVLSANLSNVPIVEPLLDTSRLVAHVDRFAREYTAIGYGLTHAANSPDDSGIRRIRQTIPVGCIPGDSKAYLDCNKIPETSAMLRPTEFIGGDGTCQGDSGSTAYEQTEFTAGRRLSLGVLSRGGQDGDTCTGAIYTRTDTWADLILEAAAFAQRQGGYPMPEWAANPKRGNVTPPTPTPTPTPTPGGAVALGGACATDADCASAVCVAPAEGEAFTCSQACDDASPCPGGFVCSSGYCFAGVPGAAPTPSGSSGGGCAIGSPRKDAPADFGPLAAIAAMIGAVFARRRHVG